jgi:DNA-binding beta-propeller fold protein YncE
VPITRVAGNRAFTYLYSMGRFGNSMTSFQHPVDLVRSGDVLYVANASDERNNSPRITKCTLDHEWIQDIGVPGPGTGFNVLTVEKLQEGQFLWPGGLTLDRDENLFVTDQATHQVHKFATDGAFLDKWGRHGTGEGELNAPAGVAMDQNENLHIVDSLNHRVQVFTREGEYVSTWGGPGSEVGRFDRPWGITTDRHGAFYVADWGNDRVQKFSPDGEYRSTIGSPGAGRGEMLRPAGVAVDKDGDVYVCDWGNDRLNVYDEDGDFLVTITGEATEASPWLQLTLRGSPDLVKARARVDMTPDTLLRRPVAVDVGDDYKIVIVEARHHRLQFYQKDPNYQDARLNI